jgi:peptidoglycan/LPS O-acetylase OafA/YrhL
MTQIWQFFIGSCLAKFFLLARQEPARGNFANIVSELLPVSALVGLAVMIISTMDLFGVNVVLHELRWGLLATPFLALLIMSLASGRGAITAALGHSWVVLLGEASYSLYVIHWPLLVVFLHVLGNGRGISGGWAVAAIALTVCVSLGCYRYIEVPARRVLRPKPYSMSPAVTLGGVGVRVSASG